MSNVLEQPVRSEQSPSQAATSLWSLQNNTTHSPASSANSSATSIDSYIASQHRAAVAVQRRYTTGSGQQTPPPIEDLTYLGAYTRPIRAPEPPYPLPQDMYAELPTPAHSLTPRTTSSIDLDNELHSTHQPSFEEPGSPKNSGILQAASHCEDTGDVSAGKKNDDSAHGPPKIHPSGTTTDPITEGGPTSPPEPKPTIVSLVRGIFHNPKPRKGALKRVLSFIPRRLRHKREKACEPVIKNNDAGGGGKKNRK